jgi:hypothetical protein
MLVSRPVAAAGSTPAPWCLHRNKAVPIGVGGRDIEEASTMIRKLRTGEFRLYSRKVNPKTGKRRNLGTFKSRAAAEKHEREVQYFKRH